jgi:phosphoribosylformylglycinamidine (FGAM) synthase-like amidotransferase family enzyme
MLLLMAYIIYLKIKKRQSMNTNALLTDLTSEQEEKVTGGYYTSASAYVAALAQWQFNNRYSIQAQSAAKFTNPNGSVNFGAIDNRVNAIMSFRRYY